MTGEQALQCVELAILRVRDKAAKVFPRDDGLLNALGEIAGHIAEFQLLDRCAREADSVSSYATKSEKAP